MPTRLLTSDSTLPHFDAAVSRRDFLARAGGGFGSLALAALLAREADAAGAPASLAGNLVAPKAPIFPPRPKA